MTQYIHFTVLKPEYKDWNEYLKAQNGAPAIPAQEHPRLELLPEVCGALREACASLKSARNPHDMLLEHYVKLKPLVADGKLVQEKEAIVTEHLQSLAASALLAAHRQYRQMERPVTVEQLIGGLMDSYQPHQDRGLLRSRIDDLRQDITRLDRQCYNPGIRGPEDKENLIASYLCLALDCVRTQISLTLEIPKQSELQMNAAQHFNMTV